MNIKNKETAQFFEVFFLFLFYKVTLHVLFWNEILYMPIQLTFGWIGFLNSWLIDQFKLRFNKKKSFTIYKLNTIMFVLTHQCIYL